MSEVLLIDDDVELCELVSEYLVGEGFAVDMVHDGSHGLGRALEGGHDLVILDVMLPGLTGFEVLRRLRETSAVPVLMLTARGEDVDRIVGLEMGADDYLAKPFNPRELAARIRAILRRVSSGPETSDRIGVDDVVVDLGTRCVSVGDEEIPLTGVEFSLLETLVRSAGNVVSRDELSRAALFRRASAFDRSLDVHISNLRRKLGPTAVGGERIKTVRGVGYQYIRMTGGR
jgi:two-component system, OmpR family, response regulator CpxR